MTKYLFISNYLLYLYKSNEQQHTKIAAPPECRSRCKKLKTVTVMELIGKLAFGSIMAVATVISVLVFSPFLIGGWLKDRVS